MINGNMYASLRKVEEGYGTKARPQAYFKIIRPSKPEETNLKCERDEKYWFFDVLLVVMHQRCSRWHLYLL
jgi:hypothetical protein